MAHELVYSSLAHSPSHSGKSSIRRFFEKMSPSSAMAHRARGHVMEGAHALRQGGESLVVGAILGAAHAELKTGLDMGRVPLDAVVGVAGMVGGVAMAHDGVGADLRNAGASGLTIYAFRKTHDLLAEKKLARGEVPGSSKGTKVAGEDGVSGGVDVGEDPILAVARSL
jgi:hypothetical protein